MEQRLLCTSTKPLLRSVTAYHQSSSNNRGSFSKKVQEICHTYVSLISVPLTIKVSGLVHGYSSSPTVVFVIVGCRQKTGITPNAPAATGTPTSSWRRSVVRTDIANKQ